MAEFQSLLDEALEAWADARNGFIEEVQSIPPNKFDFQPDPSVRNVRDLTVHILEVAMMMTSELTRPDTNFLRAPWPKLLEMYAKPVYQAKTKPQLVSLLRSQLREADKAFRQVGEVHMLQLITRFDGKRGTRFAWFQHGIAHEMYHRGQMTLYERMLGLKPALTRLIEAG